MRWQNIVRKLINLDIKKEIISKWESGKSVGDLSAEYGMAFHVRKIFYAFHVRKIVYAFQIYMYRS